MTDARFNIRKDFRGQLPDSLPRCAQIGRDLAKADISPAGTDRRSTLRRSSPVFLPASWRREQSEKASGPHRRRGGGGHRVPARCRSSRARPECIGSRAGRRTASAGNDVLPDRYIPRWRQSRHTLTPADKAAMVPGPHPMSRTRSPGCGTNVVPHEDTIPLVSADRMPEGLIGPGKGEHGADGFNHGLGLNSSQGI